VRPLNGAVVSSGTRFAKVGVERIGRGIVVDLTNLRSGLGV